MDCTAALAMVCIKAQRQQQTDSNAVYHYSDLVVIVHGLGDFRKLYGSWF